MPLLARLGDVKWSKLHHAYGPAEDVPDLLRALADPSSASPSLRENAKRAGRELSDHVEWVLWGNVFHQGNRWQVTASVVPFLVEILRDGPNEDSLRRFLISYLNHLAMGYPSDIFPARVDPEESFRSVEGMTDPGGAPDYDNEFLPSIWARDSYLAVENAIDTIAPLIYSEDEETALEAIALVGWFPRRAPKTVPFLRNVAQTRRDQRAAHAVVSLSQLIGADSLEYAEGLVGAEDRAVAIQAACAAVIADPSRASVQAISLMTAPLGDAAETRSVHADSLTQLVGRCLTFLPNQHRERAMEAIALQHRDATPLERVSLSASLLSLAFQGQRPPASAADLTPPQRRALEAIRDYGGFMINNAHFTNYSLMLRDFGLPESRGALETWLASNGS